MAKIKAGNGREKALESTLNDLKKRFGDGTIMKLGDAFTTRHYNLGLAKLT